MRVVDKGYWITLHLQFSLLIHNLFFSSRMVWVVHQQFPDNIKSALKTTRFKHDFNHRTFWNTLNDALIMERLTSSPRIVDIYGHCGGTVLVEVCNSLLMTVYKLKFFVVKRFETIDHKLILR